MASSSDLEALLAPRTPVWLVDMSPAGFHLDPAQLLAQPGWQQVGAALPLDLPMSWVKLRLLRFEFGFKP